jgi:hypothetical protein
MNTLPCKTRQREGYRMWVSTVPALPLLVFGVSISPTKINTGDLQGEKLRKYNISHCNR